MPEAAPAPALGAPSPVQRALRRAERAFWRSQRPDGHWDSEGNTGPSPTAQAVVALHLFGRLTPADGADYARWLRAQQRADGSFVAFPYARSGDVGATAFAWVGMHLAAPSESAEAIARARAFIDAQGGTPRILQGLEVGDLSAVYLSLAGLIDAHQLPCPPAAMSLVPGAMDLLATRFHAGILMVALQLNALVRYLRGDFGPDGQRRGLIAKAEARALVKLLDAYQNGDGGWNSYTLQTTLALPALRAAGLPDTDPRIRRGLAWLESQKIRDARGLHFDSFGTGVWSTAFDIRALLAAGVSPGDANLSRAIGWLADAQCTAPQPHMNNRRAGVPKTGGWAFERGNDTMADSDDCAVVLSALGQAVASKSGHMESALDQRVRMAIQRGRDWLLGMQNPDGGWSSFVWGLPGKSPGPAMTRAVKAKLDDPLEMLFYLVDPQPGLGDPSTEDVTGRVLHALGHIGLDTRSPEVERAIAFLQKQQADPGGWWGRWVVNDLAATSFIFLGLKAVGQDMSAPWIDKAISWVVEQQNADGGWGETQDSYPDPSRAGKGPSMAPLTGLVVQGLIDAGRGDSPAVARAVELLLRRQRVDGTWPNDDYLHAIIPPDTFYSYLEAARFYPTEALGRVAALQGQGGSIPGRWTDAQLDAARQRTDPLGDKVVSAIFAQGDLAAVNAMLGKMFVSDDPIPAGMPQPALDYFEATNKLPDWADPAQIALAQQLFARAGWEVATALFCSSLPQAYAAARGATVLTQTGAMTKHVRQRIFETAQFVFDALDTGGLLPSGRGIRSAQKVRLMHAGIRCLLLSRKDPAWDAAALGLPINQEDMAGTLLTFSNVTLEGIRGLGISVSDDEAKAWIHTWNAVSTVLGLDAQMLTRDPGDADMLMDAIRERQWTASAPGQQLAGALVDLLEEFVPVPVLKGAPVALMRTLIGDHCGDLIGLPPADWTRLLVEAAEIADPLVTNEVRQLGLSKIYDAVRQAIMHGVASAEREGKAVKFRIPVSLQRSLGKN